MAEWAPGVFVQYRTGIMTECEKHDVLGRPSEIAMFTAFEKVMIDIRALLSVLKMPFAWSDANSTNTGVQVLDRCNPSMRCRFI